MSETAKTVEFPIRDYFAASALSLGEGVWCGEGQWEGLAKRCYAIADAMLAERAKALPTSPTASKN